MTELRVSDRFNALDSDVTIRSSDGVVFRLHRKNLHLHSDAFPSQEEGEIVDLTESSDVLEIFFQYFYRQPQPDLTNIRMHTLLALSEAVEKYRVFSAIEVCKAHMRARMSSDPLAVLAYAAKHGYVDICNDVAPLTIGASTMDAINALGSSTTFAAWALYRDRRVEATTRIHDLLPSTIVKHKGGWDDCEKWWQFQAEISRYLLGHPERLLDIDEAFSRYEDLLEECDHCQKRAANWRGKSALEVRSSFRGRFA
ncbi:hypothetical protein P691DRAFT_776662 [Macrolepiota fuliginosa MF-IS2]|uniref:BTB domain-containing protein n=1 Tax=Macrolepiota fuliginosa MF-IS2 TaxID=1400762 RepID=A0A9P6C2P8_9AGAR|nr:hypothetical protein P691DRAFT_776662 [Macrolepiota fuliginosa MF-IS2]